MKPQALYHVNDTHELRTQLSTLLHIWTVDRSYGNDDWEASDAERWSQLLPLLEPLAPRTLLDSARRSAALLGLDWEQLASSPDVHLAGTRVAFRMGQEGFARAMSVRDWSLFIDRGEHVDSLLIQWLTQRPGATATEVPSGWIVGLGNATQRAAIHALLCCALRVQDDVGQLLRVWDLANCLHASQELAAALPNSVKATLARRIKEELERHASSWTLDNDLKVYAFVEHGNSNRQVPIRSSNLPSCRFTRLVEGQEAVSHLHRGFDLDYYSSRFINYMYLAEPREAEIALGLLSPGAAFEMMLLVVPSSCAKLLADLVGQVEISETMTYVLGCLPAELHVNQHRLDLSPEWELVQYFSRKLAIVSDVVEPRGVLAQGLRDLAFELNTFGMGRSNGRHNSGQYWSDDVWRWAFEHGATDRLLEALITQLNDPDADEVALVFALKALSWSDPDAAFVGRLADAAVGLYINLIGPRPQRHWSIRHLSRFGAELASLWKCVEAHPYLSGRWLFPVFWRELARKAHAKSTDQEPDYAFDAPQIVREHLSVLAAQAGHVSKSDAIFGALHKQLLEVSSLAWPTHPFSWWSLSERWWSEIHPRPLFAAFGTLYARNENGVASVRELACANLELRALADLLAGALPCEEVSGVIRETLHVRANEVLLESNPVALGEALDIAVAMLDAREARLAERFARRGLAIIEQVSTAKPHGFRGEALLFLAKALAQQGMWNEIVALDLTDAERVDELATRAMLAESHIKLAQMGDAARELDLILARDRHNPLAWHARCTLTVLEGDFKEAVRLIKKAREWLGPESDTVFAPLERAARGEAPGEDLTLPSLLGDAHWVASAGGHERAESANVASAPEQNAHLRERVVVVPKPTNIELAILTILEEEYEAVKGIMDNPKVAKDEPGETCPNLFGWTRGTLTKDDGSLIDVILARADSAGNLNSQLATLRTIDRFRPRCLLVVGVAGGIGGKALRQGDIVMATDLWYYEYGKVDRGAFTPRHRTSFPCDLRLVNAAQNFKNSSDAWMDCGETAPRVGHRPGFHKGSVASGEKVIDDLDAESFKGVRNARPELHAVEMEGAGAATAVSNALKENKVVAFGMVRGISDLPKSARSASGEDSDGSGTEERDNWKPYASAVAAKFVKEWVRSEHWPRFSL